MNERPRVELGVHRHERECGYIPQNKREKGTSMNPYKKYTCTYNPYNYCVCTPYRGRGRGRDIETDSLFGNKKQTISIRHREREGKERGDRERERGERERGRERGERERGERESKGGEREREREREREGEREGAGRSARGIGISIFDIPLAQISAITWLINVFAPPPPEE